MILNMSHSMVLLIFLKAQHEGTITLIFNIDKIPFNRFFGDTKPNLVSNDYSTIVIFIIGGVTAHEIQLVHEFGQQIKKQVR